MTGESVTSHNLRVQNGKALVNLPPGTTETRWTSVLDLRERLDLVAHQGLSWVEHWRLNVGPIWHVEWSGIPPLHNDTQGLRSPEWNPWPGEKVSLSLTKPQGVVGQSFTIDESRLEVSPGPRSTSATLQFNLRSSRGGLHPIVLPEGATVSRVLVNTKAIPLLMERRTLSVPLSPGAQTVLVEWTQPSDLNLLWSVPQVDMGIPTINAELRVNFPVDRWVWWLSGPALGPSVLFWSLLVVLVGISWALARLPGAYIQTYQWLLLSLGLSQVSLKAMPLVFMWLGAIAWRARQPELPGLFFNLRQMALVALTLAAFFVLGSSVLEGLLGAPNMQIQGNGSTDSAFTWFQDRTWDPLPSALVGSLPLWVFRLLMLAWSLWLAISVFRWSRWGFHAFMSGEAWKSE